MIVATIRFSSIFLLAALALPALAGEPKTKNYCNELPPKVRAEIYLRQSKRETAARADRLTGKDTFTSRLRASKNTEPRRYYTDLPLSIRTKIYLRQSKRETAARADKLLGVDTFTKNLERRNAMKPKRYVPRTLKLKSKNLKGRAPKRKSK